MLIDSTTLADLEVFDDPMGRGGLFALLDETRTTPGRRALRRRMTRPASDPAKIRETQLAVRFFARYPDAMELQPALLDCLRRYLDSNIVLVPEEGRLAGFVRARLRATLYRDLHREIREGVEAARALGRRLLETGRRTRALDPPEQVTLRIERLEEICRRWALVPGSGSPPAVLSHDRLLRGAGLSDLRELVDVVGDLDALGAMGRATAKQGWSIPEIADSDQFVLEAEGVYHPFVEDPVTNPIDLSGGEPLVFLTGPNMAGKTTYLRAAALVVLLSQVGMGVPARRARVSPVDVLLTSLNPADNLRAGLSFFLSEVQRVREAATHLVERRRCFVVFDEVFKGTNVRDALEASAEVILGFARARGSGFIFSSHLVELVERLRTEPRVRFGYFDGRVVDGRAEYSYRVRPGVSDERLGLQLLAEERIPELIARIAAASSR